MEVTEEFLQEIEKDMQSNNGNWVSNENVTKLIAEIRRLKGLIKPCCQKKNCVK
jgi:hypothetical protein